MPEVLRAASPRIAALVPADAVDDVRQRLLALANERIDGGPELDQSWAVAAQTLGSGKLVRPGILLAVAAAAHAPPERAEIVEELAVAVELLHHAFLLHDDVIDHDTLRRGRPNLVAVMGEKLVEEGPDLARRRREAGEAAAILTGDLLLARAHQVVARVDLPRPARLALLDALDVSIVHSAAGELADIRYAVGRARPGLDAVLAMSELKTGAYTVRLPLVWGLVAAGAPVPPVVERYAAALGLAFQLQDDLLGVFGDPAAVGKDPYSDLREGKYTALMAYAQRTAAWPAIESVLGDADAAPAEAERVVRLLAECGAREAVEDRLAIALAEARLAAAEAGDIAEVLVALVDSLAERRS